MKNLSAVTVADRLREARVARGLTREQLAVKAGLYSETVRRIEHGYGFSFATLAAIAAALDMTPGELIGDATA